MDSRGVSVEVHGLKELREKLEANKLIARPIRAALQKLADAGKAAAKGHAPRRSGRLDNRVSNKLDPRPLPGYAVIKTDALGDNRYGYPRMLEFSPKHGHKDWLLNALDSVRNQAASLLSEAAREIESTWGRK